MNIDEDVKRIAESLLEIAPANNAVIATIYSGNFTSRHLGLPYYQNSNSITKMISDGVLTLLEQGEDGQPASNASAIHYFTNYKVSFAPQDIRDYLTKLESEPLGKTTNKPHKEIYEWNNLVLNISEYTLTYKDSPPFKISPTREIKLLRLLMANHPNVVPYIEVAKKVGIDVGDETMNPNSVNKDAAQDVQKVRQDLIDNFLKPAGMTENEAKSIIVNVRNAGYKLG